MHLPKPFAVCILIYICETFYVPVNVVDGEVLHIVKISRLHMGAYLCIASNGVPPSVSKRVSLRVQCKLLIFPRYQRISITRINIP